MTESARKQEFRPGSRTDGLAPISVAARSLAAQPVHWLSLAAVSFAALFADQLTKQVVASQLPLDHEVQVLGPFSIHHVQNSGIAFGLFASATPVVIVLTAVSFLGAVPFVALRALQSLHERAERQRLPELAEGEGIVAGAAQEHVVAAAADLDHRPVGICRQRADAVQNRRQQGLDDARDQETGAREIACHA